MVPGARARSILQRNGEYLWKPLATSRCASLSEMRLPRGKRLAVGMRERFWKTFCTSLGIPVKVVEFWTCCPPKIQLKQWRAPVIQIPPTFGPSFLSPQVCPGIKPRRLTAPPPFFFLSTFAVLTHHPLLHDVSCTVYRVIVLSSVPGQLFSRGRRRYWQQKAARGSGRGKKACKTT